ncbi:BLUF domain-containing protein [Nocardioides solisilvae]|uniref:BLUF domain-containing protein n=1 Tax=Nocardioides solisilvae TaxID=1542435 RepID=UPI0013A599F8|nr:BLUF domain-containing protein [Nocardioides solisilvae]
MLSLTYISTATRPLDDDELSSLLAATRERNAEAGLTGMLLHADGHFLQTLEGETAVVEAAFERIRVDRRHRNVDVALREELGERRFPDWSMGFRSVDGDALSSLPGFTHYLDGGSVAALDGPGHAGVFHRVFRDSMR